MNTIDTNPELLSGDSQSDILVNATMPQVRQGTLYRGGGRNDKYGQTTSTACGTNGAATSATVNVPTTQLANQYGASKIAYPRSRYDQGDEGKQLVVEAQHNDYTDMQVQEDVDPALKGKGLQVTPGLPQDLEQIKSPATL